ncbi:YbaN family protein [Christensenella tenuis]|jgi:uncharacterized protein|uniref:YbaN family protein n=1 Tax=Christensenella tenuis TaxID=2763033 RepID=A0ABR7EF15_9FIRM|nr:YbaN family protein [Christensenella tenuis]MBC5648372.1 YbaN family protein [Christensenella tenuis]
MTIRTAAVTIVGFILLALGAIGIVLPVWPTTPFVIAAAGCFTYVPAMRARIMKIPFFKEYIENYSKRKGLTVKTIAISLAFLWGMLALSSALMKRVWLLPVLAAVGAAVTAHILWMARPRGKAREWKAGGSEEA